MNKWTNEILALFSLIVILAMAGCNSPRFPPPAVRGILDSNVWARIIASNNATVLDQYKDERQYYLNGTTNNRPQTPRLGLALSGGGMRSGIFSIGVLHGLADIGHLKHIDVISSVSGGGYAASWLYVQSLLDSSHAESLFATDGKYIQYLTNHGELMAHTRASAFISREFEYASRDAAFTVASWPVNLFANGLFGWHANVVPVRRLYEKGIDNMYDVDPHTNGKQSSLDLGDFNFSYLLGLNQPKHIEFDKLGPLIIKDKLPFPIVNTTAHIEDAPGYELGPLQNRVFEFTPLRYGSDYFGYYTHFPFDYNRAVSISGAAVDSTDYAHGSTSRMLASSFNADLGYFINNPTTNVTAAGRALRRLLPLPFYPFSGHYQRDVHGDRIYPIFPK